MTLNSSKNKKYNLLILISGLVLLCVSLSNVFIYNRIVSFQHLLNKKDKLVQELRSTNIDLKNQIYKLLDKPNLSQLAQTHGLIKIQKPEYLEINTNDSLSFHNSSN